VKVVVFVAYCSDENIKHLCLFYNLINPHTLSLNKIVAVCAVGWAFAFGAVCCVTLF
jgi:hypothetical protein